MLASCPKHLFSGEQDYLCMYYITQQVPVRVRKHSAIVLFIGWLRMLYTIYSEKYVSTQVAFLSYISSVLSKLKVPLMTHRDFPKWESGLSDIPASVFRCTSELGLWMTSIHWVIINIYPQGVANHRLISIYYLRRKTFYC